MSSLKWLTPNSAPTGTKQISLIVPEQWEFEAAIRGALVPLFDPENWELNGALTVDETLQYLEDSVYGTLKDWSECSGMANNIGEVFFFAAETPPVGALVCNGASLLRSEYPALYDTIGVTYGAVDNDHFSLPNISARTIIATGQISGGTLRELGDVGGAETVPLTASNLPEHLHSVPISSQNITTAPVGPTTAVIRSGGSLNTNNAGFGTAHGNMQPFIALTACIWAE